MIAAGIVLAVIIIIALLRVGADAVYDSNGLVLKVFAGLVSIRLLPERTISAEEEEKKEKKKALKKARAEEKKKKKKLKAEKRRLKAEKKKSKTKTDSDSSEQKSGKRGGTVDLILSMLPSVKKVLGRFRRKLLIKRLKVYYTSAGEDPYSTAMAFGYASAGMGVLMPFLYNHFRVRKCDLRADFDFDAKEPYVYIEARVSLAIWEIIYILLGISLGTLVRNMSGSGRKEGGHRMTGGSGDAGNADEP